MDAYDLITSGLQLRKLLAKRVEPIMEEYGLRPVELDILEFITKENIDRQNDKNKTSKRKNRNSTKKKK